MSVETKVRAFILWPSGRIEEVDSDGETWDYDPEPSLYADLLFSGYPLSNDGAWSWAEAFDLTVDADAPDTVTAHVCGEHAAEVDMGALSGLFLAWYHRNA